MTSAKAIRLSTVLWLAPVWFALPVLAGPPGNDLTPLSPEQVKLTEAMLGFLSKTEADFLTTVTRFNGAAPIQANSFEYDDADYTVKVTRGEVIEKAGLTVSTTKKGIRPYTQDAAWSRTITIDIHPKTPLVGFLHGFVALQYNGDGKSSMGGSMDVVPGTRIEEDLTFIKEAVDRVFARHGADLTNYRKVVSSGQRIKNLKAARVGVSFYARPFLDVKQENFDLVTETFEVFINAYFEVLERRKNQPHTPADLAAQDTMRIRWLEDQMIHDPYAMKVIPFAVRSSANFPPEIKY